MGFIGLGGAGFGFPDPVSSRRFCGGLRHGGDQALDTAKRLMIC